MSNFKVVEKLKFNFEAFPRTWRPETQMLHNKATRLPSNVRYFHRTENSLVKKALTWKTAIDPAVTQSQAVKAFKESLARSINYSSFPNPSGREFRVLNKLLEYAHIEHGDKRVQLRKLYNLIIQRKISNKDIYAAIVSIHDDTVINVAQPRDLEQENQDSGSKLKDEEHVLKIHPHKLAYLNNVLQQIESGKEDELSTVVKEILHENRQPKKGGVPIDHSVNIDLKFLQGFLEKAEEQKKVEGRLAREQEKQYKWNQTESPKNFSISSMLFGDISSSKRSHSNILSRLLGSPNAFTDNKKHPNINSASTELLIYDLNRNSKEIAPIESQSGLFHINYKDLFGVINGSGRSPEQMLDVISSFEKDGWDLIGDMYGEHDRIVFQRATHNNGANKSEKRKSVKIFLLSTLGLGTTLFLVNEYYGIAGSDKSSIK